HRRIIVPHTTLTVNIASLILHTTPIKTILSTVLNRTLSINHQPCIRARPQSELHPQHPTAIRTSISTDHIHHLHPLLLQTHCSIAFHHSQLLRRATATTASHNSPSLPRSEIVTMRQQPVHLLQRLTFHLQQL